MQQIKCLIVDDEPFAVELLKSYAVKCGFITLVGTCGSAEQALEILKKEEVDLLLLDIQMPGASGLELGAVLRRMEEFSTSGKPLIIFTTAFEQYAIEGYKVNSVGYLLKPISYPEFLEAVQKAARVLEGMSAGAAGGASSGSAVGGFLYVKSGYKLVRVDLSTIIYIESQKDYIAINTSVSAAPIMTQISTKEIESKLEGGSFYRVHRSFIINSSYIESLGKSKIVLKNPSGGKSISIPVGDSYKEVISKIIQK
ncbi:MAG: response regulator transcription factor [Bacteroidales bacterium]|nr:response regulator transcription factor [Bacteroidales bacterium]